MGFMLDGFKSPCTVGKRVPADQDRRLNLTPEQYALLREHFVPIIHKQLGYETHEPEVDRFHASNARTKLITCPARTSKSYAGWYDAVPDIFMHGSLVGVDPDIETQIIWIVAPNYELAKEFDYAYQDLVERKEKLGFDYKIEESSFSPAQGNMRIRIRWGKNAHGRDVDTLVVVKSAANEKQLQSEEVDIAILSEAARLPEIVWSKYLSTRTGRSIWPTTPDIQAAWIHEMIEAGRKDPSLAIEDFKFTPRANPTYKYERFWVEHAKAEMRVDASADALHPPDVTAPPSATNGHDCFNPVVGCAAMRDAGFAEQFGGAWTFHRGRVMPIRDREGDDGAPSHIIHRDLEWFKHADVHVSFDYGFSDGCAVLFWYVGPKQVVLRRSIYEKGLIPDDVVRRTHQVIEEMGWEGRITRMVGDPKKPEVVELFRRRGLPIWDVDKNAQVDRKAGHMELMNYLAVNPMTGQPALLIHKDNSSVIKEWMTLRYSEKALRKDESAAAIVGADHAYDAARYYVMSRPPIQVWDGKERSSIDAGEFARVRQQILAQRAAAGRMKRTVPRAPSRNWIGAA